LPNYFVTIPPWSGCSLAVQIVRFVDESFPRWVASEFVDAEGQVHTFIAKVPIFSIDDLNASTEYPQPGIIRCEVLDRWKDPSGKELIRVTTDKPDSVESTEGLSEFVVMPIQLSKIIPEGDSSR